MVAHEVWLIDPRDNEPEEVVFRGTRHECEAWLDEWNKNPLDRVAEIRLSVYPGRQPEKGGAA